MLVTLTSAPHAAAAPRPTRAAPRTTPRIGPRALPRATPRRAPRCAPRIATTADIGPLAGVLARAFADDPTIRWFVRQDARREEGMQRFFTWFLRDALPHGISTTTASLDGVALWCPPDCWRMSLWRQAALLPEILRICGATNAPSRLRGIDLLSRRHPRRPHYYLPLLGVEPARQGAGIGSALLRPVLERCDATGTPAYLENTREENLPLYERHGFRVVEELLLPDGPRQWLMWREPQH